MGSAISRTAVPAKNVASKVEEVVEFQISDSENGEMNKGAKTRSLPKPLHTTNLACKRTGIAFDPAMTSHRSKSKPKHPESPSRIEAIYDKLKGKKLLEKCIQVTSRKALLEEIESVHPRTHIESIQAAVMKVVEREGADVMLSNDTYVCETSFDCACIACGALLEVTRRVLYGELDNGMAIIRPPGHHCEREKAMGFCLFNNVAIASKVAKRWGASKTLIIDWDVHHGNGTQQIFEDDPTVLYFSVHRGGGFFPNSGRIGDVGSGDGVGYSVNVPWPKTGMGDAEYFACFDEVLLPIGREFNPDLVIVSAGFDAVEGDPIGGMNVSAKGFGHLTTKILNLAHGKVVLALEGGYNLEALSEAAAECVDALLGNIPEEIATIPPCNFRCAIAQYLTYLRGTEATSLLREVIQIQQNYWNCFEIQTLEAENDDVEIEVTPMRPNAKAESHLEDIAQKRFPERLKLKHPLLNRDSSRKKFDSADWVMGNG